MSRLTAEGYANIDEQEYPTVDMLRRWHNEFTG